MRYNCPHCLSLKSRPEAYRWYELPLALVWVRPFRCRRCGTRFLRSARVPIDFRQLAVG